MTKRVADVDKIVIRDLMLCWWIVAIVFFCQTSAIVWLVLFRILPLDIRAILVGIGFLIFALMCVPTDKLKNHDYIREV